MARVPRRPTGSGSAAAGGGARPAPAGEDAFLLSLVDGVLDESELSFVTGRPEPELGAALDRLAAAGHVVFGPPSAPAASPAAPTTGALDDDDEAGVDLEPERRRAIRELYDKLEHLDHHGVLGVAVSATKGQIRAAYHRLAPSYHPDRHFRKNLGTYKKRIEAIFARVTQAYEALRKEARSDPPPAAPARTPDGSSVPPARDSIPSAPRLTPTGSVPPPRPSRPTGEASSAPPPPAPRATYVPAPRSAEDAAAAERARRDALARKLGVAPRASQPARGSGPPRSTAPPPEAGGQRITQTRFKPLGSEPPDAADVPYAPPPGVAMSAAEVLRQRYDDVADRARSLRRDRLVAHAREAALRGDHAAAAAALAAASSLAPHDAELLRMAREAEQRAGGTRAKS
ncbi:MAG: DnaJ domain-containing protein [Polyangiaceae bacterium]|nr:DnaJ domain-containing protein [Polyangiaceae bacterium]